MNIIVGISWPFANGPLHIGHAASSLPGDVIARYHRQKGNEVILVSGSDCHGTPIDVKALQEGKSAKEIVDACHTAFVRDFRELGFSFDLYNRTDDPYHKDFVQKQFIKYYENGYLYEKVEKQHFCTHCSLFLADRYIVGVCPKCGADIKGDECEKCGSLLTIEEVKSTRCAICGKETTLKETQNLYFALSTFQNQIEKLVDTHQSVWRASAVDFTKRYLKEGIPDRCASRSLNWGIDIPIEGYEDKKIYGWFENVWGYVTASKKYCEEKGLSWESFWKQGSSSQIYLVHAKDNIPFHTVIFPSLLLATQEDYRLPDRIISDCHITIEGEKLSKSKGNYIPVRYLLDRYPVDAIRYYFLYNEATKKDFNFSWKDFIDSINGELLGKWGNFVHRNLAFIERSFGGVIESCEIDEKIESEIKVLFEKVGTDIEEGNVREGLHTIFEYIGYANKYFDENKPWILAKEDPEGCKRVLFNCCHIIFNINTLLKPYLPISCEKVESFLNQSQDRWGYTRLKHLKLGEKMSPLYERYDKARIEEELRYLHR